MKKIALFIILILIGFCVYILYNKPEIDKTNEKPITEVVEDNTNEEIEETEVNDNLPTIKIGLYKNYRNGSNRKLINEYESTWTYHKDISSFEVYYTNEDEIANTNQIKLFDVYKNEYGDIDNYRIGYKIEFMVNDTKIEKTIISPKDTEEFYNYLEVYLYDDYHRHGEWYSHTTESEFNEDTLLTSIKLTAGKDINEITSDITLSTFVYMSDNIDYNNIYTITIKKQA